VESLKKELMEAQKSRQDLMRWKLVLVSVIGAAALGFSKSPSAEQAGLALCLIPLACCYVDLLCRNLSVRTKLISGFLSRESKIASAVEARFEDCYKQFNDARGKKSLEDFALLGSTCFLSVVIVPVGIAALTKQVPDWPAVLKLSIEWPGLLFLCAGGSGLLLSLFIQLRYARQRDLIEQDAWPWYKTAPQGPAAISCETSESNAAPPIGDGHLASWFMWVCLIGLSGYWATSLYERTKASSRSAVDRTSQRERINSPSGAFS